MRTARSPPPTAVRSERVPAGACRVPPCQGQGPARAGLRVCDWDEWGSGAVGSSWDGWTPLGQECQEWQEDQEDQKCPDPLGRD